MINKLKIALLLFVLVLTNGLPSTTLAQSSNGEISVSANETVKNPSSFSKAYFLISAKDTSAKKAFSKLSEIENSFLNSSKQIEFKKLSEQVIFSNEKTTTNSLGIQPKSSNLILEKSIEIRVENGEDLAKIIDIAKNLDITLLGPSISLAKANDKVKEKAIASAIAKVKSKAAAIAKNMGVTLGKMISTSVTEESQNMAVFRGQKVGGVAATRNPPAARVSVQARFKAE